MDSFHAKIGWTRQRKRENRNYNSVPVLLEVLEKIPKKIAKKFKKLKNAIMASFQAKIGWKKLRREKIKIIVPFRSYPTRNRKFRKNSKKIQKFKKFHYDFISSQYWLEKDEKE